MNKQVPMLRVRLSAMEREELKNKANQLTQGNQSELIRRLIMIKSDDISKITEKKKGVKEKNKMLYEINKIGNNLNQLTLKVNRGQIVFSAEVLSTLQEVKQLIESFTTNNQKK